MIATAPLLGHDCQWQKKHGGRECDSYAPEHKQPPVDAAIIGGQRGQGEEKLDTLATAAESNRKEN